MPKIDLKALPPEEAVRFFKSKGLAIGFNWRDVWQEEHAVAFTVAKAMRIDILEDIRGAMDTAIARGVTFDEFRKNLAPVLQAKGWWGKKTLTDPVTGEQVKARLGSNRRLRIIFDTNMRTAYAAGRWERIQRVKARRPFLRYVAVQDDRTRPQHAAWHGTVLGVDDAFWSTHTPPNGWRCRCTVQQLSRRDLDRKGIEPAEKAPPKKTRTLKDKRTGRTIKVPDGIDPGFAHNVGEARLRAFSPPPKGGLPTSFPPGTDAPPMPEPRAASAGRLMPDGLTEDEYARRFLKNFGAAPGRPVTFTDKVGEDLVISEDLFRADDGTVKISKFMRHRFLNIAADTIRDPDEIWWFWEEVAKRPGTWTLRRRYLARWELPGQESAVAVFEHGQDGWRGTTAFAPAKGRARAQDRYLEGQRTGLLAYRRKN